jgi:hypothetical protein
VTSPTISHRMEKSGWMHLGSSVSLMETSMVLVLVWLGSLLAFSGLLGEAD